MALTNAQFAVALAAALADFHNGETDEAGFAAAAEPLFDQIWQGGASVATAAKQSATAITSLNTFLQQAIDWYAGAIDGGPNEDGYYPLTDAAGNTYLLPCPARLIADLSGFVPKGHVANVGSLPSSDNEVGDFYTVAGAGGAPNRGYGWDGSAWIDLGEWQGDKGETGDAATIAVGTVATGDPGTDVEVVNSGTSGAAIFDITIPRGDPGADAEEISLQTSATHIQWRRGEGSWIDLVSLDSLAEDGVDGVDGVDGEEVELRVDSGNIEWRLGEGTWTTLIALSALTGPQGPAIELQTSATHIQWRVVGDPTWIDLVTLDSLAEDGADGEEVSLRVEGENIEWRLGEGTWTTLIALSAITGPEGAPFQIDEEGLFSERSTYDGETPGFRFLATDGADGLGGPAVFYRRLDPTGWGPAVEFQGPQGTPGVGVPSGGDAGQILAKASGDDHDTEWVAPPSGGGIEWVAVNANGTLTPGQGELVDASGGTIERALPGTITLGETFVIRALGGSVRVTAGAHTIEFNAAAIGGDLLIEEGQTAHLVAAASDTVEIV